MRNFLGAAFTGALWFAFIFLVVKNGSHPVADASGQASYKAWVFQRGIDFAASKWSYVAVPSSYVWFNLVFLGVLTGSFVVLIVHKRRQTEWADTYERIQWVAVLVYMLSDAFCVNGIIKRG